MKLNSRGQPWSAEDDRDQEFWRKFGQDRDRFRIDAKQPLTPKEDAQQRQKAAAEQAAVSQEQRDEAMRLHQLPPTLTREEKLAVRGREKGMAFAIAVLEEGLITGREFRAVEGALLTEALGAAPMEEYIAARNSGLADHVLSRVGGETKEFADAAMKKIARIVLERAQDDGITTDAEFVERMQTIGMLPSEYLNVNGELIAPAENIGADIWARRMNPDVDFKPGDLIPGLERDEHTGRFKAQDDLHVSSDFAVAWKAAREPGDGLAGMQNALAADKRQYAEEAAAKAKAARSEAKDAADAVVSSAATITQGS